ncbi:histidine phosphatase family protein [Nocardiopsis lambiniae]|uniref:Histidine phosphatase family protein n=1 Tax=Nocardiopsis lambiniae TaxID=3075539 RepID=A0ABU2M750_9ACTN|nr:histidine phosphatase family protein [Nocardiopsis sp. DSM 44743]MDT0328499.1 histidine phosphatase family protein [Nocardiopsis sp. DSM 44743]
MPSIYLIRHGKASPEAEDYDELSPTGYEQARLLGAELKRRDLRPGPVLAGGLRRQRQTAATALAEAGIDVDPLIDERWNEYEHLELLTRHPIGEGTLQERLDAGLSAWIAAGGTGAGTWEDFRAGVRAALSDTVARLERGETALVFTSAGVIATVCAALLEAPTHGFLALNRIVVNGSITKVMHGRGGTRLLSFNDHAHLEQGGAGLMTYR